MSDQSHQAWTVIRRGSWTIPCSTVLADCYNQQLTIGTYRNEKKAGVSREQNVSIHG